VTTDIEANRQLISHTKDGFLFEPGSPEDLADNIIYAFSNAISTSVLSEKREHIKDRIYWSNVAKRFITLYNHLLA